MPSTTQERPEQEPYETPDNPLLQPDWARVAKGYEDEMRDAYARGDHEAAVMWRDCADAAWGDYSNRNW